jgi:hypothetical protein
MNDLRNELVVALRVNLAAIESLSAKMSLSSAKEP